MLLSIISAGLGIIVSKTFHEMLLNITIIFWIGSNYINTKQLEDKE